MLQVSWEEANVCKSWKVCGSVQCIVGNCSYTGTTWPGRNDAITLFLHSYILLYGTSHLLRYTGTGSDSTIQAWHTLLTDQGVKASIG